MRTADSLRVAFTALAVLVAIPSPAAAEDCNRNGVPDDRDVLPVNLGFRRGASLFTDEDFRGMAAGDLDGDGLEDIAAATPLRVQVHLAMRDGGFREPVGFVVGGPDFMDTVDLDGDGTEELLVLERTMRSVLVLRLEERAAERVLSRVASVPTGTFPHHVTAGDFDGDGSLDFAVGFRADTFQVELFLLDGLAFRAAPVSGVAPGFRLVGSMDADLDGMADLVSIDQSGATAVPAVHWNRGSGSFSLMTVTPVAADGAVPGDFDGDGDPDLLIDGRDPSILVNDPASRSFRPGGKIETDPSETPIARDFDGDGDLDIAARSEEKLWIGLNAGDGTFAAAPGAGVRDLPGTGSLVAGDFDGDRDVDLALGMEIYPGGGHAFVLENRPVSLSLDCDRDGVPDECVPGLAPACDDCDRNGIPDAEEIAAGVADANENGVPDRCEGVLDIRLRIRAPYLVNGSAETPIRVPASVGVRTLGLEKDEPGIQGWAIRIRADGGRITSATTEGTQAGPPPAGLWSRGFTKIELPGETRCGEDVMESAVVLSLYDNVALPQRSSEVLRLEVEVTPSTEERVCSLEFQRNCHDPSTGDGAGGDHPIEIIVTRNGESVNPSLEGTSMRIVALEFVRGDVNSDSKVDISDAIRGFMFLFLGASAPLCLDANDANDDGQVDITDGIHILNDFFIEGTAIPAPGPFECGIDPTADRVSCGTYAFCE